MALSIVVPCFDEKDTISEILTSISNAGLGVTEVIVVDDGSTDGTQRILEELSDKIDKLIVHEHNLGKGAALRSGFKAIRLRFTVRRYEYEAVWIERNLLNRLTELGVIAVHIEDDQIR